MFHNVHKKAAACWSPTSPERHVISTYLLLKLYISWKTSYLNFLFLKPHISWKTSYLNLFIAEAPYLLEDKLSPLTKFITLQKNCFFYSHFIHGLDWNFKNWTDFWNLMFSPPLPISPPLLPLINLLVLPSRLIFQYPVCLHNFYNFSYFIIFTNI